jgi:hypothetical protein
MLPLNDALSELYEGRPSQGANVFDKIHNRQGSTLHLYEDSDSCCE